MSFKRLSHHRLSLGLLALVLSMAPVSSQSPTFYPDDPIAIDDDMLLDASEVVPIEDSNVYDFVANTFANPGIRHDVRALNVNTIGEVPDSSWFVNRIGSGHGAAELVRGPDRFDSVSLDGWKASGASRAACSQGSE
jgi:hypothetical protein